MDGDAAGTATETETGTATATATGNETGHERGHETHVPIVFCHMLYKYVWFVHRLWYVSDGDGCANGKTESKLNKFPRSERRCKKLCGLLIRSELYGHVYINLARECVRAKLTTSLRLARLHNDNCDCAPQPQTQWDRDRDCPLKCCYFLANFAGTCSDMTEPWVRARIIIIIIIMRRLTTHPCPFLTTDTCCDNNVWSLAACRADVAPSMSTKVARSASWLETTLALSPTQSPTPISFRIPALDGACLQMFVAPNEFGVLRLSPNYPAHMYVWMYLFAHIHIPYTHTSVSLYLLESLNWVVNF